MAATEPIRNKQQLHDMAEYFRSRGAADVEFRLYIALKNIAPRLPEQKSKYPELDTRKIFVFPHGGNVVNNAADSAVERFHRITDMPIIHS